RMQSCDQYGQTPVFERHLEKVASQRSAPFPVRATSEWRGAACGAKRPVMGMPVPGGRVGVGDVRSQVLVHCKRRRRPAARQSRDTDCPARSSAYLLSSSAASIGAPLLRLDVAGGDDVAPFFDRCIDMSDVFL